MYWAISVKHSDILLDRIKTFWKTGTHCGTSSSKPEKALVVFVSLISMSFAKVSLFRHSFSAISPSHPFCSHDGGQPHQTLLQRSSTQPFFSADLQNSTSPTPSKFPVMHAGSLLPWLWGSIPLCPHTDQEWRALLLPPLPLLTLEEGNVCNFQISDVPALTGPWIRVEQPKDCKGGPSDCRVCEKRVGRSPLLQSPCPKTEKLYCLLGEGWLSI